MSEVDERICMLLKVHEVRGLEMLYTAYYQSLALWVDTYLDNMKASEDIVQDLFVRLWEKGVTARLQPATLRSYLFAAARNMALNALERFDPLKRSSRLDLVRTVDIAYDSLTDEMLDTVGREISRLSPRTREVVEGIYLEGLRYREVAQKMNISVETVKSTLKAAMKQLRRTCSRKDIHTILLFIRYRVSCKF